MESFNISGDSERDPEDMAIPFPKNQMRSIYSLKYNDYLSKPYEKTNVLTGRIYSRDNRQNEAKLLRHLSFLTFTRANKEVSVGCYIRKREMNHWPCVSATCQGYLSSHVPYLEQNKHSFKMKNPRRRPEKWKLSRRK